MSKLTGNRKRATVLLLTAAAASMALLLVESGSIFGSAATRSKPWRLLPQAPIRIDAGLAGAWTGEEWLVSGVTAAPDGTSLGAAEVAAAYRPATGTWRKLAAPPQTESYCRRSAAWTGEELLAWGCAQTGLDPRTDRWRRLPPAPTGPPGLVAWTGRELIGWGGGCCGDASAGGAAYDPASNAWRKLARSPLAPSQGPVGAWTGRELILFVSGHDPDGRPAGGARAAAYDPRTDAWRVIAPPPALRAAAVWDGDEILLAGGLDEHGAPATDGYAYDPATNRMVQPLHGNGGARLRAHGGRRGRLSKLVAERPLDRVRRRRRRPPQGLVGRPAERQRTSSRCGRMELLVCRAPDGRLARPRQRLRRVPRLDRRPGRPPEARASGRRRSPRCGVVARRA